MERTDIMRGRIQRRARCQTRRPWCGVALQVVVDCPGEGVSHATGNEQGLGVF